MRAPRARRPVALVGVVFLLVALGLGAVAVLLTAVPPALPASPGGGSTGPPLFGTVTTLLGWSVLALVGVWLAVHFAQRWRTGATSVPGRMYAVLIAIFLVGVALFGVLRFVATPGPADAYGPSAPGPNTSKNASGSTPSNNSTAPVGLPPAFSGIPGWVGYALLAVGIVAVAAVLVPVLARMAQPRSGRRPGPTSDRRQELERAIRALSTPPAEATARERIIAAYAALLGRLEDRGEELGTRTVREIERGSLRHHQIPDQSAHDLTALFEEARYSPHELGEAEVDRVRRALERALASLPATAGLL